MPPVIIYMHGIGNKVAPEQLRRQWDRALFGGSLGERSRMAYWADLRYPRPLGESGEEATEVEESAELATVLTDDGTALRTSDVAPPAEFAEAVLAAAVEEADGTDTGTDAGTEAAGADTAGSDTDTSGADTGAPSPEFAYWACRMTYAADALAGGEAPVPPSGMEVLPLPRFLRQAAFRALVETTLKDVYAYFFGGQRDAMQDRLREVLSDVDGPAVVIGHSLGSVIAYDVLRSLDGDGPDVPLFVTLGSPLGVQEIQDVVVRPLEVPRPARRWVNACDARDLVALDATLRDEFDPAERLRDYIVANESENHHGVGDYLRSAVVQQSVYAAMEFDRGPSESGDGPQRAGDGRATPPHAPAPSPAPTPVGTGPGTARESGEGLHTGVTNIEVEIGEIDETLIDEPEPGPVDAREPAGDGTEFAGGRRDLESGAVLTAPATSFPDVGEASFGGAEEVTAPPTQPRRGRFSSPRVGRVMESVLGPDDRIQITETDQYPWSAIASLLITARDSSQWIGTGWFVSPRTLVTAGHCVYITNSPVAARNGWVLSIQVLPGRDRSALPFGSATSSQFWTVRGWSEDGNEQYDYGAIVLPTPLGETVGTFGFAVFPDADLLQRVANIAGYPGDKTPGTLWYDSRKTALLSPSKVYYEADTAGGQSGAPVYVIDDNRRIGVAVHAYGGATSNSGTRISRPVFDNLTAWKE